MSDAGESRQNVRGGVGLDRPAARLEIEAPYGAWRVVVRPLTPDDAPAVSAAVDDSLPELRRFMIWAHVPQTVETQRARLAGVQAAYWRGDDFGLGAFHADTGAFAGGFGLHRRALNPKALELGYWVRTCDAGKGLATVVSRALIAYCFRWLGCERVQCGYNAGNAASARVVEKCGFKREGVLRFYEPTPTDAMVAAGCLAQETMILSGIVRSDLAALAWLPAATAALRVYDRLGSAALPA